MPVSADRRMMNADYMYGTQIVTADFFDMNLYISFFYIFSQ